MRRSFDWLIPEIRWENDLIKWLHLFSYFHPWTVHQIEGKRSGSVKKVLYELWQDLQDYPSSLWPRIHRMLWKCYKAELCGLVVLWSWRWRACPKSLVIWFISERSDQRGARLFDSVLSLEAAWWRLRGDTDPPPSSSSNSRGGGEHCLIQQ